MFCLLHLSFSATPFSLFHQEREQVKCFITKKAVFRKGMKEIEHNSHLYYCIMVKY